jgi:hypothetical protein
MVVTRLHYIVDRVSFALVKDFYNVAHSGAYFSLLDSNDSQIYYFNMLSTTFYRVNLTTATAAAPIDSQISTSPHAVHNMTNFGPYQYVVTMPGLPSMNFIMLINKYGTMVHDISLTFTTSIESGTLEFHGTGFNLGSLRIYFSLSAKNGGFFNFQSYYLTVDRCVNRVALVCLECLPGYYRVTTAANNLCQTTGEFAAGIGIVVAASPPLADTCADTNCNS